MTASSTDDPVAATGTLAASRRPYVIGVRHHSAVLAHAMPALLEAYGPEIVLVELPTEFAEWLPWLGHPQARAPLALGAASSDELGPQAFYPYADFSPERIAGDPEALRRANIHLDAKETIRRGSLDLPGQETLYLAQRGTFAVNQSRTQGLTTLIFIDCPQDARQLATWISPRDLAQLVRCAIDAPGYDFIVLYGVSANTRSRWKNPAAQRIGYRPQDNAEDHAHALDTAPRNDDDPAVAFHGGSFCAIEFTNKISKL